MIIATYNRCAMLHRCLSALSAQTQPATDFEVIVVVDGSTDSTREMLEDLTVPFRLMVIWQENAGQPAALNRGAQEASGRTCLFIDDDIVAGPGLVEEHVRLQRSPVIGLGRLTISVPGNADALTRHYADWWVRHYRRLDAGRELRVTDCFSGNLSVPRDSFLTSGGFATDLPRLFDIELGYRLHQQGLPFVYSAHASGDQDYGKDARAILSDAEAEGAGEVELYRRHPSMLPNLRLGRFCSDGPGTLLLRRALLRESRLLPGVTALGAVLGRTRWAPHWHRFLYSYWFWRGVRRAIGDEDLWRRVTSGTVILMYHAFGQPGEIASRYVLPGRRFGRQIAWLRRRGYHVLSLEEYLSYRRSHSFPPARSVVITVDDGYAEIRTVAYPMVKRHGYHLTVFVVTRPGSNSNNWDQGMAPAGRPLLSDMAMREMQGPTVSYGAHTRSHPVLTSLPDSTAREEIVGARQDLEALIGHPPLTFAYPYGKTNDAVQSLVRAAGYEGAVGVRAGLNGPGTPQFALHRTEIRGTDSFWRFLLALWTGRTELRRRE